MDTNNAAPRPRQRDSTDCQDHRHRLKDTPLASPLSAGKALMLTPSLSSQTKTNSEIQGIATEEEPGHRESLPHPGPQV